MECGTGGVVARGHRYFCMADHLFTTSGSTAGAVGLAHKTILRIHINWKNKNNIYSPSPISEDCHYAK